MRARTLPTPIPLSIARSLHHRATDLGGCEAEVFTPKAWSPRDGIVCLYIPGGGYIGCSPLTHRNLVSRIAAASGARCFALDYRKAPHFPFPMPIDDCVAAYRHLLEAGIDPRRIVLAGDSAGGGLAIATMLRARDAALPLPRCAVLLSPWVDLACSRASIQTNARFDYLSAQNLAFAIRQYIGTGDARHPHVSSVRADLTGLPPTLVQTGSAELFRDQNYDFVAQARAHGVRVEHDVGEGMVHVYATFAGFVPECTPAVRRIAAFIRRETSLAQPLDA